MLIEVRFFHNYPNEDRPKIIILKESGQLIDFKFSNCIIKEALYGVRVDSHLGGSILNVLCKLPASLSLWNYLYIQGLGFSIGRS